MVHAASLSHALVVTSLLTMVADYDASRIQRDKYYRISEAYNAELRGQRAEKLSRKSIRHADSVHPVQLPKTRSSPELRFPRAPQHHPYYDPPQQRDHSLLQETLLTYHNDHDRDYYDSFPPNRSSLYFPSGSRNDRRWHLSREGRHRSPDRETSNRWPPIHIPWPSGSRQPGPDSTFPPWRSRPRKVSPSFPPWDPRQLDHRSTLPSRPSRLRKVSSPSPPWDPRQLGHPSTLPSRPSRPRKVPPSFPPLDPRQSSHRPTFPPWSPHPRTVPYPENTDEYPTDDSFITTPYPEEPTTTTRTTTTSIAEKATTPSIPPILIFTTQLPPESSISTSTTEAATIPSLQHSDSNQLTSRRTKGITTTTGTRQGSIGGKNSHRKPAKLTRYKARYHSGKNLGYITVALFGVLLLLCIALVVVTGVVILRHRKRKSKSKSTSKSQTLQPRRMESADLKATEFTHTGALKLDQKLKGPVKHSLEGVSEGSLRNVEFDPQLNEIVNIGTNVDIMSGPDNGTSTGGISDRRRYSRQKLEDLWWKFK